MANATSARGRGRAGLSLLVGSLVLAGPVPLRADGPVLAAPAPPRDLGRAPLIPADLVVQPAPASAASAGPAPRLRLFRIQPGFLSETPGLDQGDDTPASTAPSRDDDGPDRLSVSFGNDNPHFDFRRRNDPGGVGFTRVNTQVLLFDTTATSLSLGLQAVAPSGTDQDGLPDSKGATVVTPAFSLFHALDDNLALQAFVGKHMPLANRAAQPVRRDLQYGLALQGPLFGEGADLLRGLFVSVGALGQMRQERDARSTTWEVMPGLHYRMAENWWVSGGVSVPVGPAKVEAGQGWQVTCSLQF